jgi:hypothetical protein
MSFVMRDPESPEPSPQRYEPDEHRTPHAPFDSSELNNIPRTTDDDPPYRNWWVVTERDGR